MNRPEGYCRLKFNDDLGYWEYRYGKRRRARATDLSFPNDAQYAIDRGPSVKRDEEFEPYPLQHLAYVLRCQPADVLQIIARFGEFYRKRDPEQVPHDSKQGA